LRASLFITCFNDTLFPQTGMATTRLLERLGHEVDFPEEQTCCGQMHLNSGYAEEALPLVRRFVRAFADAEAIVSPSASCVGMVRDQYPKLAESSGDAALSREVDAIRERTYELSELLIDRLGITDVGAYYPHRVTYHPTCHGLRGLQLGDRPLRLLRAVEAIELVELPEAEECCGFGGTFAIKNADTSAAMLVDKMRAIEQTDAEICTAGDNSCLMHIGGGLQRAGAKARTVHLAEILASTR
jgi:L-lactate dehydrogenase complex protein LldE